MTFNDPHINVHYLYGHCIIYIMVTALSIRSLHYLYGHRLFSYLAILTIITVTDKL